MDPMGTPWGSMGGPCGTMGVVVVGWWVGGWGGWGGKPHSYHQILPNSPKIIPNLILNGTQMDVTGPLAPPWAQNDIQKGA